MFRSIIIFVFFLNSAATAVYSSPKGYVHPFVATATRYVGMTETTHRSLLKEFMGIDPIEIPWCAGFINSILIENGYWGTEIVSKVPLTARSFLDWGEVVEPLNLQEGDIIVFPRVNGEPWEGHVGIYINMRKRDEQEFLVIISGNDNNEVKISERPLSSAIGFRRLTILD
jgi:uncharacterized protein (TIGR02594 family)